VVGNGEEDLTARALSAGTLQVIVGTGEFPCIVFAVGALEHHTTGSRVDGTLQGVADCGAYTVDDAALRHGAEAYARFLELQPAEYRDDWLPPGN
jgi:hypothetical protein